MTDWTPAIGLQVRVTTTAGDIIEGEIFTYDANTNCVVLGVYRLPPARVSFFLQLLPLNTDMGSATPTETWGLWAQRN